MNDNKEYPLISDTGKRYYKDTNDKGHELWVYESGVTYNKTLSKIERGNFTVENATIMQREGAIAKKEKAREKIRQYVTQEIAAISQEDIATFEDAYGSISGRLASEAYLGDATLQSRTKAFEVIGRAVGLYDKDLQLEMDTPAGKVTGDASQFLEILNKMSGGRE
jgi:hypothetical protein